MCKFENDSRVEDLNHV